MVKITFPSRIYFILNDYINYIVILYDNSPAVN